MSKRAFVRGLWGIYDNERRFYKRRQKMDDDIQFLKMTKYQSPCFTYAFGAENAKFLRSYGFECKQLSEEPILWDMDTQQFRHKLEIFKAAMEDFDEIVFLDWDTVQIKPLPKDFWQILKSKGDFQAILRMYHRTKAQWRATDRRKIPCASFVYIADKTVPSKLIELWEKHDRPWSEEIVMARYMDEQMGGWKGLDYYWDHFEPDFFVLDEGRVFTTDQLGSKDHRFSHINAPTRSKILRRRKRVPEWINLSKLGSRRRNNV